MRDEVEEPPDTGRGGRLYAPMVEVGSGSGCGVKLALFRDRHGERCAVGFTSAQKLERMLGPGYTVWPLGRGVLRELAAARGVSEVLVDPVLVAAPVSAAVSPSREPVWRMDPQMAGALVVCAAAGAAAMLLGELR